jgi:hypothetical protein
MPTDYTDEDVALQAVLDAAEAYVLDRTGYVLTSGTYTEVFRNVRYGDVLALKHRPIANVQAEIRYGADWEQLDDVVVVDANGGYVQVLEPETWPPLAAGRRCYLWDCGHDLRITYEAQALDPVPPELSDATAGLAAFWYAQQLAGPVVDSAVGPARESYVQRPVPVWLDTVLAQHERGLAVWC